MSIAALVMMPGLASAQSFEAEAKRLLESQPQINAADDNVSAADEAIGRSFADYLPALPVFADYGYQETDSPALRAARNGRELHMPREKFTATLTQNVFDGFRTTGGYRTSQHNLDIASITLDSTVQTVLFEGVSTYLNVLRNNTLLGFSKRNEGTIREQLKLEDERVSRGAGIAVDVLQSKSRLQISKERRVAF